MIEERSMPPLAAPTRWKPARWIAAVLAVFAGLVPTAASAQFSALETHDARLVYNGLSQSFIAPYTVRCFENSLRFYRNKFDFVPSEKVNIILDDTSDFMNAGAWVQPRNGLLVHLAPSSFVYETGPANERINFTMNHEMAHIVTLDQAAGADHLFRTLFNGKISPISEHPETILYAMLTVPRRTSTRWFREGMAVFMETWMSGGLGRAQGPWDEMVFRAMVQDSTRFWDPLGLESEGTKTDFQVGVNSYLYGTRFLVYMAWEYGPEKLMQWLSRGPGSSAYFASQFAKVYGKSLNAAWNDWIVWEHGFQRANLDSVHRYPVTTGRDLSRRALGSVSRAFVDSTTRSVIAGVLYPGAVAHIASVSMDDGSTRALREVKGPTLYFVTSLAFDPQGRQIFYTSDNDGWRDLNVYDLETGKSRLLIRDARIGDLVFDEQDRSIYGVRHLNGISSVVRLPEPWTNWTRLVSFPYGRDLYDLDISPDGRTLSASVGEISGRHALRLFPLETLAKGDTSSRMLYDFGSSIPQSFVYSSDGRFLYGSSYYTGVSNIWRYDLEADSIDIVTNASTGYFRPIPLGGDSLVAFRYTGEGFVPAMLHVKPLHDVSAITFLGAELVQKYPVLKTWRVPPPSSVNLDTLQEYQGDYRPAGQIRLANVYPIYENYKGRGSVGLRLDFSDPVMLHSADVAVTYTPDSNLPDDQLFHVKGDYKHGRFTAGGWYNNADFYDLFGPTKRSRKGYGGNLGYSRTLIRDDPRQLDLEAGLSGYSGLEKLPDAQNINVAPGFDISTSMDVSLSYRNLRSSIGAADKEKGWLAQGYANLTAVRFDRGSDLVWRGFPQLGGKLDVGTPFVARNSSVWLRNMAGWSPGDRDEPFANFYHGKFGNNYVDHRDPKRFRDYGSFPGVDINEIAGTNYAKSMVEVILPPVRFSRLGAMRLFAQWASLSVFSSALVTNIDSNADRRKLANVGAQLDLRLQFLVNQNLTLSGGWARAFEKHETHDEEWMLSLKIL